LAGGEDGVSPGQACVFYDAPDGQSRILGGGFIQNVADPARSRTLEAAPVGTSPP
jgi:tRNA-specific 2-thiouridylase